MKLIHSIKGAFFITSRTGHVTGNCLARLAYCHTPGIFSLGAIELNMDETFAFKDISANRKVQGVPQSQAAAKEKYRN